MTTMVNSGFNTLHTTPSTLRRYFTFRSRLIRLPKRYLYRLNTFMVSLKRLPPGIQPRMLFVLFGKEYLYPLWDLPVDV